MEMSETGDQAGVKPTRRRARKKAQTPARAFGRSLSDFGEPKPAEILLLEACAKGKPARISNIRPITATTQNRVRANFLRFLLLGGDHQTPVHERGVQLIGAWVEEELDLENTTTVSAIDCVCCTFEKNLNLRRSQIHGGIFLSGSEVPGISGDGLTTEGDIYLRQGFRATGPIRLLGSKIGGSLECDGAEIDSKGNNAINAERAVVNGSVFLRDNFKATGPVRLVGMKVGGSLELSNAHLDGQGKAALSVDRSLIRGSVFINKGFHSSGTVRLAGTQITGDLICENAEFDNSVKFPFIASNLNVSGRFFFRKLKRPTPRMWLPAAHIGGLVDDEDAWGHGLMLDGFIYDSLGNHAPTTANSRLAWIDKQQPSQCGLSGVSIDFRPQPWRHLQKVLRDMGHAEEARQVAVALEHRLRKAGLIGQSPQTLRYWP